MKLTFLGAAETVTGSKYLLEIGDKKLMIDCGLFQGRKELRKRNWEQPDFDVSSVDAILLTHGHLDHVGYLPRLVKFGFRGPVYATAPTLQIAEVILRDSANIQEEEAKRANREGYSKHTPALPLYDTDDVERAVKSFHSMNENEWFTLGEVKGRFVYNGHILGSTFIELSHNGKTIVFSGDLGRTEDLLLFPPKRPTKADALLIESTYGGRIHMDESTTMPQLEKIVNETIERGGTLLIPSFAVERAQLLMLMLWRLLEEKKIPMVPMILDSPMGANVLELFHNNRNWHKLKAEECDKMCGYFKVVSRFRETLQLRESKEPKIIIAGSGMVTGGRILNYLEKRLGNKNDTLLFIGYQAEGTRGRRLVDGEKQLKMFGKTLPVQLKVEQLDGLSAHADQQDLLDWLGDLSTPPSDIFIVHGELGQAKALQQKLKEVKGWDSAIPELNQTVDILGKVKQDIE